ncbi:MAG: DedA family protein [Bryobacteraceae bacterium]|jgi:membrane protein DedA with SNARE-associated domain
MEQHVLAWIAQYGYLAIFCLLTMGIVGLPVPDETLLTFAGYLVYAGHLSLAPAYFTALAGSLCGITLSYTLGRIFGLPLIHRFGRYIHIGEEDVGKAHAWFRRVGHWGLTFGYFVPGVRHLTAYAAGMSALEPGQFALFAYPGGAMWVATFVGLGMVLGERWHAVEANIHRYLLWAVLAAAAAATGYWLWRSRRRN